MGVDYKVLTAQAGCCGNVSQRQIEKLCNQMAADGYKLVMAYEAMTGCCCANKAAVLIFTR